MTDIDSFYHHRLRLFRKSFSEYLFSFYLGWQRSKELFALIRTAANSTGIVGGDLFLNYYYNKEFLNKTTSASVVRAPDGRFSQYRRCPSFQVAILTRYARTIHDSLKIGSYPVIPEEGGTRLTRENIYHSDDQRKYSYGRSTWPTLLSFVPVKAYTTGPNCSLLLTAR